MNPKLITRYTLATGLTVLMGVAAKLLNDGVGKPRPTMTRVQANRAIYMAAGITATTWAIAVL